MAGTTSTGGEGERYMLGDLLGRGGMAEVFSGRSTGAHGFSKPVAIKRLLPELANDHVFVERLIGEAKLHVGMQHGNIVSVLDLARVVDDVFLVMEYIDGPSLRQLLKATGSFGLPLGVSTYIVQAAAAGLEFAHARPGGAVIHADISPSNILLTTAGEVRVADFGIARREGTSPGVVEGKWAYMAPEQARNESLTPRSDVFSLGVVLYELTTGQHPFGLHPNPRAPNLPVIPPSQLNSSIPPGLEQICLRALAYEPQYRFGRMQEMFDALVDERFGNGWRDGASDLARVIRNIAPRSADNQPNTQITQSPLTIVTQSLLSVPHLAVPPPHAAMMMATPVPPGIRPTVIGTIPSNDLAHLQRMVAMMPSPPAVASEEVSSTYGGDASRSLVRHDPRSAMKWTVSALGLATVLGVVAAVAVHEPQPDEDPRAAAEPAPVAVAPGPAPEPARFAAPAAEPTIAAPVAPEPAPAPAPAPLPSAPTHRPAPAASKPTPTPTPAPRPHTASPRHSAEPNDAVLRIRTIPKVDAKVTIESSDTMIHGEIPGGKFPLTPGKYHVMLSNQDIGLWVDCGKQLIDAGTTVLTVHIQDKDCSTD